MTASTRIIAELKTCQKEFFESKLAILLTQSPELFPTVKKISDYIRDFIERNKEAVLAIIEKTPTITHELYDTQFFGRLMKKEATAEKILDAIMQTLRNHENLSQIMQIHSIFYYRIFRSLAVIPDEKIFKNKITKYFSSENRGRKEKKEIPTFSNKLGISRNKVFQKLLPNGEEHVPATHLFQPDTHSVFYAEVDEKSIPFVAGASGHTASFLRAASLYCPLTVEQLREYTLACFAFLTAGGNHSFHEVMVIAKEFGVSYTINRYDLNLPDSFLEKDKIQQLLKIIPDYSERLAYVSTREPVIKNPIYNNILSRIGLMKLKNQLKTILPLEEEYTKLIVDYAI